MVESTILKIGDTVDLTGDGSLVKTIIALGEEGPLPQKGEHIFCNYEGKLMDGTVFDSSYEKEAFTVPIGEGNVIKAWDIAIMSMKLGEKVELKCAP
jgi:FKBP-type peptidyl-prolyl cis-trans isomerase